MRNETRSHACAETSLILDMIPSGIQLTSLHGSNENRMNSYITRHISCVVGARYWSTILIVTYNWYERCTNSIGNVYLPSSFIIYVSQFSPEVSNHFPIYIHCHVIIIYCMESYDNLKTYWYFEIHTNSQCRPIELSRRCNITIIRAYTK